MTRIDKNTKFAPDFNKQDKIMKIKKSTNLTLDDLNKGNIWSITESELYQMILEAKKEDDYADYERHYMNIIRTVFDIQYLNRDEERKVAQLESMHYQVFSAPSEGNINAIAIRKHQLKKVTDLTMENVWHLEPYELLELINNNLGTGWKGLPLAIQDIIESAFFVDCSVLPASTMHRAGGIIDRRKEDGYEVLEIQRGTWIEGVFVKSKPKIEKVHIDYGLDDFDDDEKPRKRGRKKRIAEDDDDDDDFDDIPDEEPEDDDDDDDEDVEIDDRDDEDKEFDDDPSLDDYAPSDEELGKGGNIEDLDIADDDDE